MNSSEAPALKFAFYGRVSTEDQQDPEASRNWQRSRAQQLIDPHGGVIVVEFFDLGLSRSLPWRRRPEATALLEAIKAPNRPFSGVVIGEPQRAFYGNQFGLTFPLLVHYGVQLWVPEVGGRVDPGSDAHDLVMALYGGMSKGERNRIKIRVRSAMSSQAVTEGRFLGGRPPYGYRLVDAGPHPNPSKAADGKRLRRLEPDLVTSPIVHRIFDEYSSGRGLFNIASDLTAEGIPCPSANDAARNRHRSGLAWSKSAIRAILLNPRYTGRQVWNRQRREEILIDVEDVALGHETKMRWNNASDWAWSNDLAQEPIVSEETFAEVQTRLSARGRTTRIRKGRPADHPYVLRSILRCGICYRRMQGTWNHDRPYYRCFAPSDYALQNSSPHPKSVYLREDQVIGPLDDWLLTIFDPVNLPQTIRQLLGAQNNDQEVTAIQAAHARIAECDRKMQRYRTALESGTDPSLIAQWTAEVSADRQAAESRIRSAEHARLLSEQEIAGALSEIRDLHGALLESDLEQKAALYRRLGVTVTYQPNERTIVVESRPSSWGEGARSINTTL